MREWRWQGSSVVKCLLQRGFVPRSDFQGIQMVNRGHGVELVETWHNIVVLNISQATNMQDELRTATPCCNFVTRSFHLPIGKTQFLSRLAQSKTWRIH